MKKIALFLFPVILLALTSCSGILENQEARQSSESIIINITDSNSSARFIKPAESFDISKVEEWKLTFTQITPVKDKEVSITLKKGEKSAKLGVGTYNLNIEGSYANDTSTIELSGSKENIVVAEGKSTEISVIVGLKKSQDGKGSLSVQLGFDQTSYNQYITEVGQVDLKDRIKVALKNSSKEDCSSDLKIESVENQSTKLLISGKLSSGYYNIELYANCAAVSQNSATDAEPIWKHINLLTDDLIEVADEKESSGSYENLLFPLKEYTYYASASVSEDSASNGLSKTNPGNLYKVLENIYKNNAVYNAKIKYACTDPMEFDVSKIKEGKQIEIDTFDDTSQSGVSLSLHADKSVDVTQSSADVVFTASTEADKSLVVKDYTLEGKPSVILKNGAYLDFCSFANDDTSNFNLYLDVEDVEYYGNSPLVIASKSFDGKFSILSSGTEEHTVVCEILENKEENTFKYYVTKPLPTVYYSNKWASGWPVNYKLSYGNTDATSYQYSNYSLAAFCYDHSGGVYAFELALEGDSKVPGTITESTGYELVHFSNKEASKKTEFTVQKEKFGYIKQQIPASMCADGNRVYFVNTLASISEKGGQDITLSKWDHWAYSDPVVYSVAASKDGQFPAEVQLDFDSVFTKVTAVYCEGLGKDLYVAGYKTSTSGSTKDSTYSIYKLASPSSYTTDATISKDQLELVLDVFTTSSDSSFTEWCSENQITQNAYAFNAITDMAIVDSNLYILKNSYYLHFDTSNPTSSIIKACSSLVRIDSDSGNTIKAWSDYSSPYSQNSVPFGITRKFVAVLPKKKKLVIGDSSSSSYYAVDLSNSDDLSIARSGGGSGFEFDGYTYTDFVSSGATFVGQADYIENVSSN
mgnify:CR=1 FL=1